MEKIHQAQEQFLKLIDGANYQKFLEGRKKEIAKAAKTYRSLKETYENGTIDLSKDEQFKKTFKTYYGLNRVIDADFEAKYFAEMQKMRGQKNVTVDLKEIIEEVCGKGKTHFSFITKLLNIYDDSKYIIYDSKVAFIFGFDGLLSATRKYKLIELDDRYQTIAKVYADLLKDEKVKAALREFKRNFTDAENFSDMRILDILFWQFGKEQSRRAKNTED